MVNVDEDVDTYSLYAQDEAILREVLTLLAGARYDHHSTFGDEVSPKFSLMFRPWDATTFRAGIGTSFKSPTIRQLYYSSPYRHGSFYAKSNPDLKPEKAVGWDISVEQLFLDNRISAELGYFRNEVDDMVIREDTGTLYNSLPLMEYRNVESAVTQGLEFICRTRWTREFTTSLSYTYTDTENGETGRELTYVPSHAIAFSPAYDWESLGVGVSARMSYTSSQYTNTGNTQEIDGGGTVDAKIYKPWINLTDYTPDPDTELHMTLGWGHRYPLAGFLRKEAVENLEVRGPEHLELAFSSELEIKSSSIAAPGTYIIGAIRKPGFYTKTAQGGYMPVQVLFKGKPFSGNLFATYAGFSTEKSTFAYATRTDKKGRAKIRILTPGVWMIKAGHEQAYPDDKICDVESYIATLTFEVN